MDLTLSALGITARVTWCLPHPGWIAVLLGLAVILAWLIVRGGLWE